MTAFYVKHTAFPHPVMIEAFDVYGAARTYKASVEQALGSTMENGETLEVRPVGGEAVTLEWREGINNFAKPDPESEE